MGPTSILVFALSAALGFAIFHYVWEPEHPTKYEIWFEKPRITYITLGIAFFLISSIIIYSLDIHSAIGTHFWFLLVLINSPIGYSLVLGILFGLLFGYWSFMIITPDKLETESARMVHNRWGYVLALIIIVAIIGPGLRGFLERITEIKSAPFQLSLAQPQSRESSSNAVVLGAEKGDQKRISALRLSTYYTQNAIPYLINNIISDREYLYILKDINIDHISSETLDYFSEINPITECMKSIIAGTDDPQILHDLYGVLLHKMRSDYEENDKYDFDELITNPLTVLNWLIVISRTSKVPDQIVSSDECTKALLSLTRPKAGSAIAQLYYHLLISFSLGSAGANEAAIRSLADWIVETETDRATYKDDLTLDWALVRAKQYLEVALSQEGMQAARLALLRDLLSQMEALYNRAPYSVSKGILAARDKWTDPQICTDIRKIADKDGSWKHRQSNFKFTTLDKLSIEPNEYTITPPERSIALLILSYISFRHNLNETQFRMNGADLTTILNSRANAQIPKCLTMMALDNNSYQSNVLLSQYHSIYAQIILFADEYWKEKVFIVDVPNEDVKKEALRHLILAQALLDEVGITGREERPLGKNEPPVWSEIIKSGESGEVAHRREIDVLVRKLSLSVNG